MNSNPILANAQQKSPEQLTQDILKTQEILQTKMEQETKERMELLTQGWIELPVPVGSEEVEVVTDNDTGLGSETIVITKTKYAKTHMRHKIPGDPSSIEFRTPLPYQIAEQYEIRNIPSQMLILKSQSSRNLAELMDYIEKYAKLRYDEGIARGIPNNTQQNAQELSTLAELVLADIRYIIDGTTGE